MRLPRLTYANVVATLALFLALGGAAYAATQLPADSVGTRQLRAGAVTAGKLSKGVQARLAKTGKQGPRGAEGPAGPEGRPGAEGKEGKQGPASEALLGSEPQDLYVKNGFASSFDGSIGDETEDTVSTLTVPPGNYLVTAKTGGLAGPASGQVYGELFCELLADGTEVDDAGPTTPADLNAEVLTTAAVTLGHEAEIALRCFANRVAFTLNSGGTHITALPVAAIRG